MAAFDSLVQQIKSKQNNELWHAALVSFLIAMALIVLNLRTNKALIYSRQQLSVLEQQITGLVDNGEAVKGAMSDGQNKIVMEKQSSVAFVDLIRMFHGKPVCLLSVQKKSRQISIEGKARSIGHLTDIMVRWKTHFPSFNVKIGYLKRLSTGFIGFQIKMKDSNDYFSTMLDSRQKKISIL